MPSYLEQGQSGVPEQPAMPGPAAGAAPGMPGPAQGAAPEMPGPSSGGAPPADAPPEIQQAVITLGAKAKQKIYEDPKNFENMMNMLEQAGPEGFPQAASTIVNTVLDQVEKEEGPQPEDVLAAAGAIVLGAISEDLMVGGAMEVTPDMFNKAAAKAVQDWMTGHPERVDQQGIVKQLAGNQAGPPGSPPSQSSPGQPAAGPVAPGGGYLGGAQ